MLIFKVKEESLNDALETIETFVKAVNTNEEGTLFYRSLQEKYNPTNFIHYMIFKNSKAEEHHRNTEWIKVFVSKLYPVCEIQPNFTKLLNTGQLFKEKI